MSKVRKYEIVTISLIFVMSLVVLNNIYAQTSLESSGTTAISDRPVSNSGTVSAEDSLKNLDYGDTTQVLSENVETVESIRVVSDSVNEINTSVKSAQEKIRDTVKEGIDRNIIDIRQQSSIQAFELQRAIDDDRTELFDEVSRTLGGVKIGSSSDIDQLVGFIDAKIDGIEGTLRIESGLNVDFDSERRSVEGTLLGLKIEIEKMEDLIKARGGELIYKDTDGDGLSDYDEKFIFNTDPDNVNTGGGDLNDAQKIERGLNPLSDGGEEINFEDPRDDKDSFVSSNYDLESVALVKEGRNESVLFIGKAIPNSYVTVYIYSTPIIVTVKTSNNGIWSYELKEELDNGEHQFYVATVNNSGRIIARSNPILFTKSAEAASIGIVGLGTNSGGAEDFLRDNFILIALAILIGVVILALMFIGGRKNVREVVTGLQNEVNNPPK